MQYSDLLHKYYCQKYHLVRKTKLGPRYRLKRRTYETIHSINEFFPYPKSILDIGAADGLMLSQIKKKFPRAKCIGLECVEELISKNKDKNIKLIKGNAQNLPFQDKVFEIVIATAIIEHLDSPSNMMEQAYRVLKKDGILIVTTPHPFFDKINELLGYFTRNRALGAEAHIRTFNLVELKNIFQETGFKVIKTEKFMISPIGFPAELKIEKLIKLLKLNFMLMNQLIVGRK